MTDFISRRELIRSERTKQILEDQNRAKRLYYHLLGPNNSSFVDTELKDDYKTIIRLKHNEKYKTEEQLVIENLKDLPSLKKLLKKAKKKKIRYVRTDEKIHNRTLDRIYSHLKGKRYKENRLQKLKHSKKIDPVANLDWPVNMKRRKKFTTRNNEKYIYSRLNYAAQRRAHSQKIGGDENSISMYSGFTKISPSNKDRERMSRLGRLTNPSFARTKGDLFQKSDSKLHKSVDGGYKNRSEGVSEGKKKRQVKNFELILEKSKKKGKFIGARMRVNKTSKALERMKMKSITRLPKKKKKKLKKKDLLIIAPYLNSAMRRNQGKGNNRSRSLF